LVTWNESRVMEDAERRATYNMLNPPVTRSDYVFRHLRVK